MSFTDLGLAPNLLRSVRDEGYTEPDPIQAQAIPHALAGATSSAARRPAPARRRRSRCRSSSASPRRRPRGRARGRSACLVLTPTRELALADRRELRDLRQAPARSGTPSSSAASARSRRCRRCARGVDILVATPGRLLDLMQQRLRRPRRSVEIFVLDEADRMLDMGFIHDVRRVIAAAARASGRRCSSRRRCRARSATLADRILHDPVSVAVTPPVDDGRADRAVGATSSRRPTSARCSSHLLARHGDHARARVHAHQARRRTASPSTSTSAGIRAEAIHGNKSQNARERALDAASRPAAMRVLVATDIAARGIDIDDDHARRQLRPARTSPETYVHRIGRTGARRRLGHRDLVLRRSRSAPSCATSSG